VYKINRRGRILEELHKGVGMYTDDSIFTEKERFCKEVSGEWTLWQKPRNLNSGNTSEE